MGTTVRKAHDLRITLEKDIRALCLRYEEQTGADIISVTVRRVFYPRDEASKTEESHSFLVEVKVEV